MEMTSMRSFIFSSVAALALGVSAPALFAQTTTITSYTMTSEQKAAHDAWVAERVAAYAAWPATYQEYYWTLTPSQQNGWWVLNDAQRGQVYAMTPDGRVTAWTSIEAQLAGQPVTATTSTSAPVAAAPAAAPATAADANASAPPIATTTTTITPTPMGAAVASTTTTGNMAPPPADAMGKSYPVCTSKMQDSCQNRGEGGAPGRSRAISTYRPKS